MAFPVENKGGLYPNRAESSLSPILTFEIGKNRRATVMVWSDMDGTLVREMSEPDKIAHIKEGREALHELELMGIKTALLTGKSFLRGENYRRALGIDFTFVEEGEVIRLPAGNLPDQFMDDIYTGVRIREEGVKPCDLLVPKNIMLEPFIEFISEFEGQKGEKIISTVNSATEEILTKVSHDRADIIEDNKRRYASVQLYGLSRELLQEIEQEAQKKNLRLSSGLLFSMDIDKGSALRFALQHPELFFPGQNIQRIIPVVFGNNENDLSGFEVAKNEGGVCVMVGHQEPGKRFWINEDRIPKGPNIITTPGIPAGEGMQAALPQVYDRLTHMYPSLKEKLKIITR